MISATKTVAWKLIQWVLKATAPPIQSQHILRVPRFWMAAETKIKKQCIGGFREKRVYSNVGLGSSLRGEPGLTTFRSQGCP